MPSVMSPDRRDEVDRLGGGGWMGPGRRLWRRLFSCSCLRAEEGNPLNPEPQETDQGTGLLERETVHITVEDLGEVNLSFSLAGEEEEARVEEEAGEEEEAGVEEEVPAWMSSGTRSVSSLLTCQKILSKKTLRALSSLPLQDRADRAGEEEEEELLEADSMPASASLLLPPIIHLIPPTPSDVIDDDQFFDINSEEESLTLASDSSYGTGEQESDEERGEEGKDRREEGEEKTEEGKERGHEGKERREEEERRNEGKERVEEEEDREEGKEVNVDPGVESQDVGDVGPEPGKTTGGEDSEMKRPTASFLRQAFQVAPLPEYPRKRSFNTGINLLSFTEHNLDDFSNKDGVCHELLTAELRLLPVSAQMENFTHLRRKPAARTCSLGDTTTRSHTFHTVTQMKDQSQEEEGSPRQRRITVASFMPPCKDQNGNIAEKGLDRQGSRSLGDFSTDEVCQWFLSIGLPKCLPFIKASGLRGADVVSVDVNTLEVLHISSLEEREQLLSAIYREIHPPSSSAKELDFLLETLGPNNVESFTAALVSMSKSRSSPQVSCLNTNRCSVKLSNRNHNYLEQKNSQLIEITINASDRMVHLRAPKETSVGKVVESCTRMMNMTEEKGLFTLKEEPGCSEDLPPDLQIGSLASSEKRQLELHLCKKERAKTIQDPKINDVCENSVSQNLQVSLPGKEEKIKALNQQVDSLQHVILQVQDLHQGLVAFCSELKSMEGEAELEKLSSSDLQIRLKEAQERLRDTRQSLQAVREPRDQAAPQGSGRSEIRLLDKMRTNCQVFKEEISVVHLNRRVSHLQTALQDCQRKERTQRKLSSLGQLVSPSCPAMLLLLEERRGADGCYGFTCRLTQGCGLVVVEADHSHLCLNDRLVEVNGVPVLGCSEEELCSLLLQGPSAQILVLRQPPPCSSPQQTPPGCHDNQEAIDTDRHDDQEAIDTGCHDNQEAIDNGRHDNQEAIELDPHVNQDAIDTGHHDNQETIVHSLSIDRASVTMATPQFHELMAI